jgi:putative transcriptional regulator
MEQTSNFISFKDHFLIAMPSLMDPHFFHSVTYICEHTEERSIGIIINQPLLNVRLGDVLNQIGIHTALPEVEAQIVFSGGPMHPERGFILHNIGPEWQNTVNIGQNIALTTSVDILQAIAVNEGPTHSFIALGYAYWEAGQLEQEIANNAWLFGPSSDDILFHMAIDYRWRSAASLMGVDLDKLSGDIGHA